MRHRLRFALPLLAALCLAGAAVAEPLGSHWEFTPFGGTTMFDAKLRFPGSNKPVKDGAHVGARLAWQSTSWVGLEAAAGMSSTAEDVSGGRDYDWQHVSGNFVISPAKGRWGGPYAFVGGGYTKGKPSAGPGVSSGSIEFGGGVKLWMTDNLGLRLEARDVSFKPLVATAASDHLHNVVLGVGLTFALGATPRDTDGDGVPDKKDKCPDTPKGAKVDANGCPLDSDGDRVFDGLDQCEGTPKGATVDAKGCPSDADGDGVLDGLDQCPDTPKGATVDAKGCPKDSDGDGVLDGLDQCPDTPKGATVDAKGCPKDSDGDGVLDGLDQCPDTPAGLKVDDKGCPTEVAPRETELLETGMIRIDNVQFDEGQATIKPESYPTLDVVGLLLKNWPQLKIEIGGHTDSKGAALANLKLSQARAEAVRAHLLEKFPTLDPTSLTAKGYGKTKPIAPNTTDENRAKNRRVEFVVTNKAVLKQEIAKRAPAAAPADSTKK